MLAYILVDETFERVNQGIIIDSSIDVSKRHSPKQKVEKLKDESLVLNGFKEVSSRIIPLLINNIAVCFGKDDFVSFNDQLKIIGSEPLKGEYYDIESFIRDNRIDLPTNLGDAASLLELEHDAHNPLSDSFITLEYFK